MVDNGEWRVFPFFPFPFSLSVLSWLNQAKLTVGRPASGWLEVVTRSRKVKGCLIEVCVGGLKALDSCWND